MITYVTGDKLDVSEIYKGFMIGFSDYIIKVDLAEASFVSRFFGPEGNDLKLCHVALDEGKPIGLVMGGIRQWDGKKTLRCGALCIAPDYRGREVTKTLMERHWQDGVDNRCERLSLEVIKGNDRAVRFYEKNGYYASYDIKYFRTKADQISLKLDAEIISLKEITFDMLENHRKNNPGVHIHWQSETDYYKDSAIDKHFEINAPKGIVGYISLGNNGKVNYLWIEPSFRNMGYGRTALKEAAQMMGVEGISIAFVNNGLLEGLVRALQFDKDGVEQFEMFKSVVEKGVCQ